MKLYVTNFIEDQIKSEAEVTGIREAIYCASMSDGELVFAVPKLDLCYTASEKEARKFFCSAYYSGVHDSSKGYLSTVLESLGSTIEEVKESM